MIIFVFIAICFFLYVGFKLFTKKDLFKKNKKIISFNKRNFNEWMNLTKKERYNLSKKDSASYFHKRKVLLEKIRKEYQSIPKQKKLLKMLQDYSIFYLKKVIKDIQT